ALALVFTRRKIIRQAGSACGNERKSVPVPGKVASLKTRSNIMNTTALKHTIFLAGMMVASMTFAGQDVIKCVDSGGNVTLTDTACGNGVEVAREPVAVETDYAAEVAL
ncbi:DUF4124 domain-containing protein, partial [Flavobacterium cupreum]